MTDEIKPTEQCDNRGGACLACRVGLGCDPVLANALDCAERVAKYHAERAGYGGAGFEMHARAQTFLLDLPSILARVRAEAHAKGRGEGIEEAARVAGGALVTEGMSPWPVFVAAKIRALAGKGE